MFAEGHIHASLPLFEGVEIPFSIYGDELKVSFPIPTDRLRLGPVEVMAVGEISSVETTVLEHTYFTLQRAFQNIGSESVAGGYGFWFGNGTGPLAPRT